MPKITIETNGDLSFTDSNVTQSIYFHFNCGLRKGNGKFPADDELWIPIIYDGDLGDIEVEGNYTGCQPKEISENLGIWERDQEWNSCKPDGYQLTQRQKDYEGKNQLTIKGYRLYFLSESPTPNRTRFFQRAKCTLVYRKPPEFCEHTPPTPLSRHNFACC